jgi:hypothetical protein
VLGGLQEVGGGTSEEEDSLVSAPTVFGVAPRNTRYLRIDAVNDGTYGSPNCIELRAVKMYNKRCPVSCDDIEESGKNMGDGTYAVDTESIGLGGSGNALECTF